MASYPGASLQKSKYQCCGAEPDPLMPKLLRSGAGAEITGSF